MLKHLRKRRLNVNLHKTWVDDAEGVATFPLWNLSGQMVGYQQYRPSADKARKNHPREGRYFTRRQNMSVAVWGLESWNLSPTLFVTEGIFDAAALTNLGFSAVATLFNDPDPSSLKWFSVVRQMRRVVAVCDNDPAGRKLAKVGHYFDITGSKDLGDSTDDEVMELARRWM